MREFTKCMKEWEKWFDSDISRCIVGQVQHLLFGTFIFKLLQKAYELSDSETVNGKEIKKQNQMLHWFIDRNYVKSVHIDIRRLIDGSRDVISLKILLDEMKGKYSLLTRENYAKKFECFVDLSKHKEEYLDKTSANSTKSKSCDEIEFSKITDPFILKYQKSERFHGRFDKLCNKDSISRDAGDVVGSYVFDELNEKLTECKGLIKILVNKVFAHTDKKWFSDNVSVEYSVIFKANKILVDVVKFISLNLLGDYSISMLPSPPTNWHKYLNEPFVNKKHPKEISGLWQDYSNELNS